MQTFQQTKVLQGYFRPKHSQYYDLTKYTNINLISLYKDSTRIKSINNKTKHTQVTTLPKLQAESMVYTNLSMTDKTKVLLQRCEGRMSHYVDILLLHLCFRHQNLLSSSSRMHFTSHNSSATKHDYYYY